MRVAGPPPMRPVVVAAVVVEAPAPRAQPPRVAAALSGVLEQRRPSPELPSLTPVVGAAAPIPASAPTVGWVAEARAVKVTRPRRTRREPMVRPTPAVAVAAADGAEREGQEAAASSSFATTGSCHAVPQ